MIILKQTMCDRFMVVMHKCVIGCYPKKFSTEFCVIKPEI